MRLGRLLVTTVLMAVAGCSLLVTDDIPAFHCASTDPSACPPSMRCSLETGTCVSADRPAPEAGADNNVVDAPSTDAPRDATTLPSADGSLCRVDAECASKLCGSSTILTSTITQTTGPICTRPCCSSSECGASFVCFHGGTGGGYCVPASLAQRQAPASGGKGGGTACSSNGECRSGLCEKPDGGAARCFDTCCATTDCAAGTTCRVKAVTSPGPSHDAWVCAAPEVGATKNPGDACTDQKDCISNLCIGAVTSPSGLCRPPCSSTAACRKIHGFEQGQCLYQSTGPDFIKFCYAATTANSAPAGAACTDNSMCQSDFCDGELKRCAQVCARDADCAVTEACRPSAANTPYLRCVPKP